MDVDSKKVIKFYTLIIFLLITGVQYVINTLTNEYINTSWNTKNSKISPKLMQTRYNSVICIFYMPLMDHNT